LNGWPPPSSSGLCVGYTSAAKKTLTGWITWVASQVVTCSLYHTTDSKSLTHNRGQCTISQYYESSSGLQLNETLKRWRARKLVFCFFLQCPDVSLRVYTAGYVRNFLLCYLEGNGSATVFDDIRQIEPS